MKNTSGLTVVQIVAAASDVLEEFHADLKQMLADERTPEREKQFLQSQLLMMPSAFCLLGAAAGRDAKKRADAARAKGDTE